MLAFGGNLTGFNVVNYFARNMDKALLGRFWGELELGLYSKAYSLLLLPLSLLNAPLSAVLIPALSRLQSSADRFREYYLDAISSIALVGIPGIMFMMVASRDLILLVLGERWLAAAPIFASLGPAALCGLITNTTGWLFISKGDTRRMLKWGCFSSAVIVVGFIIGLPFGAQRIAMIYSLFKLLLLWPCFWYSTRGTSVSPRHVFRVLRGPTIASGLAASLVLIFVQFSSCGSAYLRVLLGFLIMSLSYFLFLFIIPGQKTRYRRVANALFKQWRGHVTKTHV